MKREELFFEDLNFFFRFFSGNSQKSYSFLESYSFENEYDL